MIDYIDSNHDDLLKIEDSKLSFGSYLKKVRLEKGLSIEDIMEYSKISNHMVQLIEADNISKLPEPVYLKGFLKTYAKAVGVDPDDVIERYKRALNKEMITAETSRDNQGIRRVSYKSVKPPRENRKGGGMKWMILLLLVVFVVIGVFIYKNYTKSTVEKPVDTVQTNQEPVAVTEKPEVPPTETEMASEEKNTENKVVEGFLLEVVCVEATTVKVSVDGGSPDEYAMKPEEHIELNAKTMFNILIENKCGVNVSLNNNPVTLPGKCGQSVNIQLP